MGRRAHWSEWHTCTCGFKSLDYCKAARHRHNFPALCRKPPTKYKFRVVGTNRTVTVSTRASLTGADALARGVLDRRAEKQGREPPVAWTIELMIGTS
jgi:hypothetical protein